MQRATSKLRRAGWRGLLALASLVTGALGMGASGCYADYGPMPADLHPSDAGYPCSVDENCSDLLGADWYCDEGICAPVKSDTDPDAGN